MVGPVVGPRRVGRWVTLRFTGSERLSLLLLGEEALLPGLGVCGVCVESSIVDEGVCSK